MQNQSFDYKKEQLINSYISIPTKQTINMFVKVCFMNETANFEKYYRNLRELDREIAYFSLRKSKEDKEYYYSKFPNSKNEYLSYENIIPNKFEDIIISDLSIEILNFIYFEYFLFKQVKSFKENFNFLVDEFLKTKIHQLTSLENEFIELKKRQELLSVDELGFEGIDYHRLYDLIETSHKEVWLFIESRFNLIKSNNKSSASKKAIETKNESKNPYPRIFIKSDGFILFEELINNLLKEDKFKHSKCSFIFRQMQTDKYIYADISESTFRNFLSEEYEIAVHKLKTLNNCSPNSRLMLYNSLKN